MQEAASNLGADNGLSSLNAGDGCSHAASKPESVVEDVVETMIAPTSELAPWEIEDENTLQFVDPTMADPDEYSDGESLCDQQQHLQDIIKEEEYDDDDSESIDSGLSYSNPLFKKVPTKVTKENLSEALKTCKTWHWGMSPYQRQK